MGPATRFAELEVVLQGDALDAATAANVFLDGEPIARYEFRPGDDFVAGVTVATTTTILGDHSVTIELLNARGGVSDTRSRFVDVRGDTTVVVAFTRSCSDIMCAPRETCVDGMCVPEMCECGDDDDCPTTGCARGVCDGCSCSQRDDDALCPGVAFCEAAMCIDACMCMTDADCPAPPPVGCARAVCRSCTCELFADSDLCFPPARCDEASFTCVGETQLDVILRTDYLPAEFDIAEVQIDGGPIVTHIADPDDNYVTGVRIARETVSFGPHEVSLFLVGVMESRIRMIDVSGPETLSFLVTRP